MMPYILAAAVALGGFLGWRVTSWAYDADYKSQVQQVATEYEQKRQTGEALIRKQLSAEQKTRIVYRTLKEAANEITIHDCLDPDAVGLWNQATAEANRPAPGESDDALRPGATTNARRLAGRALKSSRHITDTLLLSHPPTRPDSMDQQN